MSIELHVEISAVREKSTYIECARSAGFRVNHFVRRSISDSRLGPRCRLGLIWIKGNDMKTMFLLVTTFRDH